MSTLSKDNKLEEQKRRRNERARAKYASLPEEEKEREGEKRWDAYKRRKQQACEDEASRLLLQQPLEVNDGDQQNSRPCYTCSMTLNKKR